MKYLLYGICVAGIAVLTVMDIMVEMSLFHRFLFPLLFCALLCLIRIILGPTAPDRTVAIDILGIVIIGLCAILAVITGRSFFMDIAIAWALQSFIAVLALAKYLEGRTFDA
ncbi:MAG: monovalent cation/H+ antiporter complex subunit F [bacterium]